MSEGEGAVVGVTPGTDDEVAEAVAAAGATARVVPVADLDTAGLDAVVAVGESSLLELARTDPTPSTPVLPVEAGPGVRSVSRTAVASALGALSDGAYEVVDLPVLDVEVDGRRRTRALLDVTLVTAEAARISEYGVASAGERVAQFRADGVVVATPAGSHGYVRAVDGPVVAPGTGVLAAAPIAPFATDADRWVLPDDALRLSVERDDAAVELMADDRRVCPVDSSTTVALTPADTLSLLTVSQSAGAFEYEYEYGSD